MGESTHLWAQHIAKLILLTPPYLPPTQLLQVA